MRNLIVRGGSHFRTPREQRRKTGLDWLSAMSRRIRELLAFGANRISSLIQSRISVEWPKKVRRRVRVEVKFVWRAPISSAVFGTVCMYAIFGVGMNDRGRDRFRGVERLWTDVLTPCLRR